MKPLIVVPVYNCDAVITQVLESLVKATSLPILVVDDGSHLAVKNPRPSRIQIMRLEVNQGKGVAIQKALQWAQKQGYSHILTFDGDGQHLAQDVDQLLQCSEKNPRAIVIGCREFDSSVPRISRFGRKFSNFWVWYQTSLKVKDSQSGLRVYPVEFLSKLSYFCRRYDFEIEILVRGVWKGLEVKEVDVGVFYPPKDERISHFNKIWDNVRITSLNILLIAYSLIFYQRSFFKIILVGLLSFLASLVPFSWGLILGTMTCVILRLNVILFLLSFTTLFFI